MITDVEETILFSVESPVFAGEEFKSKWKLYKFPWVKSICFSEYVYVICRPGGPCWEKLCQRSWVRPEAGPRSVLKTEGTVFPNTDRPRPANNVFIFFFPRVLCKQFLCWIFTAAIFKPGVRVRLTFRKSEIIGIGIHNCLFLRSLFTFYVLCSKKKTAGKDAKAGKLVAAVRTRGPDGKIRTAGARAISQSDSRI